MKKEILFKDILKMIKELGLLELFNLEKAIYEELEFRSNKLKEIKK